MTHLSWSRSVLQPGECRSQPHIGLRHVSKQRPTIFGTLTDKPLCDHNSGGAVFGKLAVAKSLIHLLRYGP
ncbi:hypothetical protein AOLI_G00278060 [Acnodon oligacanthus]